MQKMAVSFFTHYIIGQFKEGRFETVEKAFEHCYKTGIRYGDMLRFMEEYPLHLHCDLLRSSGIEPECLIDCFGITDFDVNVRKAEVASAKEKIDVLSKLNVPLMMLVPKIVCVRSEEESKRHLELMIESFSELCRYAEGSGVTITFENQSEPRRPDSYAENIKTVLNAVDGLMYVFDSGNYFCVKRDTLQAYEMLKDRIVHIHAKDWTYSPYGDFASADLPRYKGAPLGCGVVPLAEIAEKAKADNYKGSAVVEINSPFRWEEFDASAMFLADKFGV